MAHYRVLYIGNPDNIYLEENNLFNNDKGDTGKLADYGVPFAGIKVKGSAVNMLVDNTKLEYIDWKNSHYPCAVFIEQTKEIFIGHKGYGSPVEYDNVDDMIKLIKDKILDDDWVVMLDVHM